MSHRWTEHELRTLSGLAGAGVPLADIWQAFCAKPGTRTRTIGAIQGMLTERRLAYGNHRYIAWEHDETRLLRAMAGRATLPQIVQALRLECGSERTVTAVRARLTVLGLSAWPARDALLRTGDVAAALGVCINTVLNKIETGQLPARQEGTARCRRWYLRPADVMAYVEANPLLFDPAAMPRGPYRDRVELLRRQGRWLTTEQVAALSGRHRLTVITACRLGKLPAARVRPIGRNGTPRWWIRAAHAAAWAAAAGDRKQQIGDRAS